METEQIPKNKLMREPIEWLRVWVPDSNQTEIRVPRVLLVGDSIVAAYGQKVADVLMDEVSVAWVGTSRFPADPAYLNEIKLVLEYTRFDAIHFNNGLHGFGYSEESYAAHLGRIVRELIGHTPGAKWMLCNSTPVRVADQLDQYHTRNEHVKVRNQSMAELAHELSVPMTDLYSVMKDHPEFYSNDGTHFNEDGQKVQGEVVAKAIRKTCL
ncbi:SGNH/GDSL hydrolase family protein [Coraliomargarita parva]|uniref:SGNH/GDSL hydrolase family protein n=1 Tax=Coraliomargarita parva TaxID=3014050 RepID=UPI0022B3B955|nr:SGNH/GDSL hydrolase family protein [Coraliomargarita parva]